MEEVDGDTHRNDAGNRGRAFRVRNPNHAQADPADPHHVQTRKVRQRQDKASAKGSRSTFNKILKGCHAAIRKARADHGRTTRKHAQQNFRHNQPKKKRKKKK